MPLCKDLPYLADFLVGFFTVCFNFALAFLISI
nr:MAG TPA: hypothetical protein [Caudoviricetes sp.]